MNLKEEMRFLPKPVGAIKLIITYYVLINHFIVLFSNKIFNITSMNIYEYLIYLINKYL